MISNIKNKKRENKNGEMWVIISEYGKCTFKINGKIKLQFQSYKECLQKTFL